MRFEFVTTDFVTTPADVTFLRSYGPALFDRLAAMTTRGARA